jgi:1,5-anhydro-D-fructose reductase (1,5-anhydro-D-mannitol-forming)
MAQAPGGTVVVRTASGEETLPLMQENYYMRGVRLFHDAIAGRGAPPATGEDGVRSLAVALAALRSAASGAAEPIAPGI